MKTKKLKLYGEKDDFKGFIAEIYVKGNNLMIESGDDKVKEDLYDEINKHIKNDEFFYLPEIIETELIRGHGFSRHKLGDPKFIEALLSEFWKIIGSGHPGKFSNKKYNDYEIIAHKSEIVEEELDGKNVFEKIEEIRKYVNDQIPNIRFRNYFSDMPDEQKEMLEKEIKKSIAHKKIQKEEREKQQSGIYEQYLKELEKIPSCETAEEIILGDDVVYWNHREGDEIISKILMPNKKILVPIIASCIEETDTSAYFSKSALLLRKTKNPDGLEALQNNHYLTKLELILLGEEATRSLVISWAKIPEKNYGFSSYVKNNERTVKTELIQMMDSTLDEIGSWQKRLVFNMRGNEELKNGNLENVVITLQRTMCLGTCPAYTITIFGNGAVVYNGKHYVKVTGMKESKISSKKVRELLDEFNKIDFFSLESRPPLARDLSETFISININGYAKRIVHARGIYELGKKIDEITNSKKWVGK